MRTYKVPASWMRVTTVGSYRVVPLVNANCRSGHPKREDLFYRVMRGTEIVSDHGDRSGAILAAFKEETADRGGASHGQPVLEVGIIKAGSNPGEEV